MSRKRKRRPVAAKQVTVAQNQDNSMVASDGYVNSLAYLGEASALNRANDYERHSISDDYELLTVLYRENWLAARIIDTPCEDMTRAWYTISSEIDQERLDELQKLETKHSVKQEITNAIRWGRLYGGAAAVIVIKGQEDMLDQPLDYDTLQPGCFKGLIVVDKVRGLFPEIELEEDMDDTEFGYPKYYDVTLSEDSGEIIRIHHSRLLLFRGRQLPIDEEINQDFWGASELEHVYEELQKRNSTSANIAQLIFQANVSAIRMSDYGEVLGMGTAAQRQQVYKTMEEMNRLKTSFGILLVGNEDSYEQHPYSFAGVSEVYETFMMDMAGAAEIPATKLFGRAPQGMNATGESDMKNYYEMIEQLQERILRPAVEKLLPVMCISLWGEVPDDFEVVFEPLGSTTPSERAEITEKLTNPIIQAFSAGLISQKLALKELRETGKPIGAWTNITDDDIENADDEPDMGEGMQDPMGMMGPPQAGLEAGGQTQAGLEQMDPTQAGLEMPEETQVGLESPEATQAGLELPEETQVQPEQDERIDEIRERIGNLKQKKRIGGIRERIGNLRKEQKAEKIDELRGRIDKIREKAEAEERQERMDNIRERIENLRPDEAEDGGPGSGPRPGYHKGASIAERARFMANPTAGLREAPRAQRTPEAVKQANSERKQWSDLSLGQKVRGNAAEERHIRKVKAQVAKAAMRGDLGKAKEIVSKNRHYWSNDPDSAMKVQSETLKRQKAERKSLLHDVLSFFRKPMEEDGGPGSGNFNHAGRPGQKGGSAPGNGSSGPIDNNPRSDYNRSGKATLGWKGLKAAVEVGGPKAARKYIDAYFKKFPKIAQNSGKFMDVRRKVMDFLKDHPEAENFNTYDAETGEVKQINSGYCVTFHQNNTADDPLGGYTDKDYADLCAIACNELGTDKVNIGYYGNPEVSFECQSEEAAKRFAVEHNQQSIYNASTGRTLVNKQWRKDLNPIRL